MILSRLRLLVVSALLAALLGGCVLRVAYNQLDWLTLWSVEDYFELDDAQGRQARALIAQTLAWHRVEHLPLYARQVRALRAELGTEISDKSIAGQYDEVVRLWDDLLLKAGPGAADLLRSLSDRQVEDLFARLAEKNAELDKEYSGLDLAERRARQDKAIIRAFRRVTGRLTSAQEDLVRAHTARFDDLSVEWLQRRTAWQAQFRELMRGRKTDPQFAARLTDLMANPNQFDSGDYRKRVAGNQQRAFRMVAAVLNSLSPEQAKRLRNRLATYADDLDKLVRDGADASVQG